MTEGRLFVDKRLVDGFRLRDRGCIISAEHYTSREKATTIRNIRSFVPEGNFIYFLEQGYEADTDAIRKISGASAAEVHIDVEFLVPVQRVWLKTEKRHPVKFAILRGLEPGEIISLTFLRLT